VGGLGGTPHQCNEFQVPADAAKEKLIGMNYAFCLQERVVDEPEEGEEMLETAVVKREGVIDVESGDEEPQPLLPGAFTSVESNFTGLPDATGSKRKYCSSTQATTGSWVSKRKIVKAIASKGKKRATVVQGAGVAETKKVGHYYGIPLTQ
jgi:hypothetical protein